MRITWLQLMSIKVHFDKYVELLRGATYWKSYGKSGWNLILTVCVVECENMKTNDNPCQNSNTQHCTQYFIAGQKCTIGFITPPPPYVWRPSTLRKSRKHFARPNQMVWQCLYSISLEIDHTGHWATQIAKAPHISKAGTHMQTFVHSEAAPHLL